MDKSLNIDAKAPKTVAAIHDLSCFGRCALSVVMPTLSAMGVQVVPIPTALLSTHTGGFGNVHFKDLTDSMEGIARHFSELGLKFDAIYTGYLGGAEQIDVVAKFIKRFSDKSTVVLVDPVMGDGGKLYSACTEEMKERMYELCELADIITPNLTEATLLAGCRYIDTSDRTEYMVRVYLSRLARALYMPESSKVVVTGVPHSNGMLGTYGLIGENIYDGSLGYLHSVKKIERSFPGTGDLFASVLLGGILCGKPFDDVVRFASDYTSRVIEFSARIDAPARNGVAFEYFLSELSEYARS